VTLSNTVGFYGDMLLVSHTTHKLKHNCLRLSSTAYSFILSWITPWNRDLSTS